MRLLTAVLLGVLAVAFTACGASREDESATPGAAASTATPSPSATPSPTPGCDEKCQTVRSVTPIPTATISPPAASYPAGTRTGDATVDAILSAIEQRDATALARLISLTTEPCVAQGNRQPEPLLCKEGVAPGTPKTGIWVTHVEGGLSETTAPAFAARLLDVAIERGWRLHSIYSYESAGTTAAWRPDTRFFITFAAATANGPEFDNLRVSEIGITALHYAFPEPYEVWERSNDPGWLLPRAR